MHQFVRLAASLLTVAILSIPTAALAATETGATEEEWAALLPLAPAAPAGLVATDAELALLDLVNADRARNGLQPVEFDLEMLGVARERAASQHETTALTHFDGSGEVAFARLLADQGVGYALAGENLARSPGDDALTLERVEAALMNSPTHRKNILERSFNRLSVGAAVDANGKVVFAQIFRAVW